MSEKIAVDLQKLECSLSGSRKVMHMLKIRQQQFNQMEHDLLKNEEESLIVQVIEPPEPVKMAGKGQLTIRKDQDEKLSQVSRAVFEDRMILHINKHFPSHYEALGEVNCRELIRFGIERGATHDFISERNVCKFIDLMLCFGVEFTTDPKQAWAASILDDTSWITANTKMDALFKEGVKQLKN